MRTCVIGLAGWSGAGKTTLLAKALPLIVARGLTVSTLKHAHHSFDLDQPGKDSHTHRAAGATEVLIASANRYAVMHELRGAPEPSLYDLLGKLSPVDLVVVEGFKAAQYRSLKSFAQRSGSPRCMRMTRSLSALSAIRLFPRAGGPWCRSTTSKPSSILCSIIPNRWRTYLAWVRPRLDC
jgi:molybdopterin-guanine dinucleotide biosynthesis adapter protein